MSRNLWVLSTVVWYSLGLLAHSLTQAEQSLCRATALRITVQVRLREDVLVNDVHRSA